MRVTKDVISAIGSKISNLAHDKIESIEKPKNTSDMIYRDLKKFLENRMLATLPKLLQEYQKKNPMYKFNIKRVCSLITSFDSMYYDHHFKNCVQLEEEVKYHEKVQEIRILRENVTNEIVLQLPFIKTKEEYDAYLAEVEKKFK